MRVLITGAEGFIGKNLRLHLSERSDVEMITFTRRNEVSELAELVKKCDFVFHLAGVNRPTSESDFTIGNAELSKQLADAILESGRSIPVIYTSSIQARLDNPYGLSKKSGENALLALREHHKVPVTVFRLPNVFGKWAQPNYNSVVATFCHNIVNELPVNIHDPNSDISLVYIDDVIDHFLSVMDGEYDAEGAFAEVSPVYRTTVGKLADQLYHFHNSRKTLVTEPVGTGLVRALYSTYLSYIQKDNFTYKLPKYGDERGVFVEMLKTHDAGQFSFFTAHPGVTRGGHYHHTKTEKFLVIKGKARFKFRNMLTGINHELVTSGDIPEIVETVPGWTHDITNICDDELIVMLWANEIFNREKPDTYSSPLSC